MGTQETQNSLLTKNVDWKEKAKLFDEELKILVNTVSALKFIILTTGDEAADTEFKNEKSRALKAVILSSQERLNKLVGRLNEIIG